VNSKTSEGGSRDRCLRGVACVVIAFAAACDPSSGPSTSGSAGASGLGGASGAAGAGGGGGASGGSAFHRIRTDLTTTSIALGGSGGAAGAPTNGGGSSNAGSGASAGLGASIFTCAQSSPASSPATAVCGDGVVTAPEACDDGNTNDGDACSSQCQVTPELIDQRMASSGAPYPPGRSIGASRHPVAAGCNQVGVSFVEEQSSGYALYLATFSVAGAALGSVQYGTSLVQAADPAVAALPGNTFAAAWTDFESDGDELGVRLARVVPGASTQAAPVIANQTTNFSQSAPDIAFDGREVVVAWVDSSQPSTAPDLRYRLFDTNLRPLGDELTLASTSAVEDNVVLATLPGQWAAAWRSGSAGAETIEIQSGQTHWSVGPFAAGLDGDRPDLIFLDATHLAVAFTMGTDPTMSGVANVSRLHGAILDVSKPGHTASFEIPPAQDPYSSSPAVEQTQPSLALLPGKMLVSWHSGAALGDANGEELWLRHFPFSVGVDGTVSIDSSHVEVPLVRSAAQRVGDQSAFRLVSTNAPGGGLVTVWDDQARTFGSSSGTPDVAVQFMPEIAEPPPAVTTYPLSSDGKYYLVNVLKRNYPGPTVNATYANDARLYAGQFPPEGIFDGSNFGYAWVTPSASDPDATVVLTIDMGQYFSVGAILPWYYAPGYVDWPNTMQIRLAADTAHWTTVVPAGTPGAPFTTYEVNPPLTARFLELTQTGTSSSARINFSELFVYPSSQSSPAPTSADGYDLGSLATTTVSPNMYPPGAKLPIVWPAGNSFAYPPSATSNGYINVDYGTQYPITRVGACTTGVFAGGGRLEVAAIPDLFQTTFDSGIGQPWGNGAACLEYPMLAQPVRYLRATDYFVPNVGLSAGGMWALTAYTSPPPLKTYFPISVDGKYFNVNQVYRPLSVVQPTAAVTYAGGAVPYSPNPAAQDPNHVLDGDDMGFNWWAPGAQATASATLTVDLGQVETFGAIGTYFAASPSTISVRIADTPGQWTQLLSSVTWTGVPISFDAAHARYVELTMNGAPSTTVSLVEFELFPSAQVTPAPSSEDGFNLVGLKGMSSTLGPNMTAQGSVNGIIPGVGQPAGAGGLFYYGIANATGDGYFTYDLGQIYQISEIDFAFYQNRTWPGGGRIDVDDGSGNWSTVFDSGHGTALGLAAGGTQRCPFTKRAARYVRFIDYFVPGVGTSTGFFINPIIF